MGLGNILIATIVLCIVFLLIAEVNERYLK